MITAYLDILVFEGEKDDDWEAAYDDALKNEEYGPQNPVEGDDARGAVHAVLATFGTHQALKPCVGTTDPGAIQLKPKKNIIFKHVFTQNTKLANLKSIKNLEVFNTDSENN